MLRWLLNVIVGVVLVCASGLVGLMHLPLKRKVEQTDIRWAFTPNPPVKWLTEPPR